MSLTEFFGNPNAKLHPLLTDFYTIRYLDSWYEQQHTNQNAEFGPGTGMTADGYCPGVTGQCFITFFGN